MVCKEEKGQEKEGDSQSETGVNNNGSWLVSTPYVHGWPLTHSRFALLKPIRIECKSICVINLKSHPTPSQVQVVCQAEVGAAMQGYEGRNQRSGSMEYEAQLQWDRTRMLDAHFLHGLRRALARARAAGMI